MGTAPASLGLISADRRRVNWNDLIRSRHPTNTSIKTFDRYLSDMTI
jgi:hypothetical protein